ncbi:MAG: hypothetical protein B7Z47_00970 [Chthoniobacter sp. 12-60-6]|nr:MAG: hypothetical protein B7Z47_00970 [Chthoniobacter sp. 12-60-6]
MSHMKPAIPEQFANDPLFLAVMKDALEIQDRFAAEPIYAKTGKGFLKSAGVEEIKKAKDQAKSARPAKT